jgi:hypothetical protein
VHVSDASSVSRLSRRVKRNGAAGAPEWLQLACRAVGLQLPAAVDGACSDVYEFSLLCRRATRQDDLAGVECGNTGKRAAHAKRHRARVVMALQSASRLPTE